MVFSKCLINVYSVPFKTRHLATIGSFLETVVILEPCIKDLDFINLRLHRRENSQLRLTRKCKQVKLKIKAVWDSSFQTGCDSAKYHTVLSVEGGIYLDG